MSETSEFTPYLDKELQPLSQEAWEDLHSDDDYRQVAVTELPDNRVLSTIWTGFDKTATTRHSLHRARVFETTLIVPGRGRGRKSTAALLQGHQTMEEALAWHAACAARLEAESETADDGGASAD